MRPREKRPWLPEPPALLPEVERKHYFAAAHMSEFHEHGEEEGRCPLCESSK